MTVQDLISPAYREEQIRLHTLPKAYGERGHKWSTHIHTIVWVRGCASILDYGCGTGSLGLTLRESILLAKRCKDFRDYDPAIPGKDALPAPADLVVCTDVLEHVEPDKIDAVLDHLTGLAQKRLFVAIALTDTAHLLSDGRQAHILLREPEWWREQLGVRGFVTEDVFIHTKPQKAWIAVLRRETDA
jgi:hypothetical protein